MDKPTLPKRWQPPFEAVDDGDGRCSVYASDTYVCIGDYARLRDDEAKAIAYALNQVYGPNGLEAENERLKSALESIQLVVRAQKEDAPEMASVSRLQYLHQVIDSVGQELKKRVALLENPQDEL
jgi:hypothetical protein